MFILGIWTSSRSSLICQKDRAFTIELPKEQQSAVHMHMDFVLFNFIGSFVYFYTDITTSLL